MGTYVSLQELKDTLGVGNLYSDATLNQVIDAVDNVVDSYLDHNRIGVSYYEVTDNVAKLYTLAPHGFIKGQTVTVSRVATALNGSKVLTDVSTYSFSYAAVTADVERTHLKPSGSALGPETTTFSTIPELREGCLALCVDVFQSRLAPGGQTEAVDFTPGPFRLGRSMVSRIHGMIAKHLDVGSLIA